MVRALAILLALIQLSFAFHALKTGRDQKWISSRAKSAKR